MHVEFWFDPGCPFTWITSRWLERVATDRALTIEWRSLSLLIKNKTPDDKPWYPKHRRARDLLRVIEAVRESGHVDRIGALYAEFGRQIHNIENLDFDVAEILTAVGVEPALAGAADDDRWDAAIESSMAEGFGLAGDDVGSPLIAITGRGGRVGFSGPVLTELPSVDDSLELWDGFVKMAGTPGFWELKRTRTMGPTPPPESVLDA